MNRLISFSRSTAGTGVRSMGRHALLVWVVFSFSNSFVFSQNLKSMPEYRADKKVSGVIRSWGSNHMGTLTTYWEEGFRKYQPKVWFEDTLKGTASAQFGLHLNVADLALSGRQIFPYEYYGIYRRSQMYTVEIAVATGSYDVLSKSTAIGVFVHKDNPISKLTLKQLDGIYGDQRNGGWQVMDWNTDVARTEKENIRTWGQLGLTGEWADKPIQIYGTDATQSLWAGTIQKVVFKGGTKWNPAIREMVRGDHVRG